VRQGRQGPQDLLVLTEQLVLRGYREQLVKRELLVLRVMMATKAYRVLKALLEHREHRVLRETLATLGQRELKAQ